jgi:copper chaperone CopZ
MRTLINCLFLLLLSFSASAQFKVAKLNVLGLTCSACSFGTEKSIRRLKFVEDVKIDLNTNIAEITFKKGEPVSIEQLVKKVYDAGFSVGKVSATYHFTNETLNGKSWKVGEDTYMNLSANAVDPKGDKELVFVGEKYMKKNEYLRLML